MKGDILSLDMGVVLDGYYGDSALTVGVGTISEQAETLLRVTRQALERAIERVRVGGRVSDLGHAVQQCVEMSGFSVVREFVGHGIGTQLHEEPQIPNYGEPGRGPRLLEGMVLAIEPMVNAGGPEVRVLDDGWDGCDARRESVGTFRALGCGDEGRASHPESPNRLTARGAHPGQLMFAQSGRRVQVL